MKKMKTVLAMFVMMIIVTANCTTAQASVNGMEVTGGEMSVRELSVQEKELLLGEATMGNMGETESLPMATNSSYTAYEYSRSFDFRLDGELVARADAVCIVWHYTDGKVHLYRRTITMSRLATYDASRTYGSIVNTDGSLSYTTGDRVHIYGITNTWDYALDFRVTPTDASFDCYEI